ncbi:uncharacterized protein [Triticum aestivum]|uniref:uncharacterized protein n=1 Tax=Triticum aestivum TaxID=4565 RepID=UPI001D002928|nr:uncharacterized protein LOC123154949 [Triticum aestivum]
MGGGRRAELKEGEASTSRRLPSESGRQREASPTAWAGPPGAVLPQIRVSAMHPVCRFPRSRRLYDHLCSLPPCTKPRRDGGEANLKCATSDLACWVAIPGPLNSTQSIHLFVPHYAALG